MMTRLLIELINARNSKSRKRRETGKHKGLAVNSTNRNARIKIIYKMELTSFFRVRRNVIKIGNHYPNTN